MSYILNHRFPSTNSLLWKRSLLVLFTVSTLGHQTFTEPGPPIPLMPDKAPSAFDLPLIPLLGSLCLV